MTGTIALVGAGLGDPELLTVKGLRKIKQADVIIYDRLINPAILNACKAGAEKIYVGKMPNYHPVPQDKIETIMIEKAFAGKKVVRLKSGDPYVFGRGGEEGASLRQAGVPFEVIPGITSSIGGLAYAGIPITHRDLAASFHVYTGHLNTSEQDVDWANAAKTEGTLVFLMGMSELERITQELIAHGKNPDTPAAIIQWASRKQQKTAVGTLETIYAKAVEANLKPPSLIVIGEVVERRKDLNFFEERPLFSTSIAVPYTKKKKIVNKLTDLGAEIIELPPARLKLSTETLDFQRYQQVVFTDKASVAMFIQAMATAKVDWRQLGHLRLVTVGHHTSDELIKIGIQPDQQLSELSDCSELINAKTLILGNQRTLNTLTETGIKVISHEEAIEDVIPDLWQQTDLMYFPNSKSARLFLQALGTEELDILKTKKIIVMGKMTKAVFEEYHVPVIQTAEPSYESVLEQIIRELNK